MQERKTMRKLFLILILLFSATSMRAQNLTGQLTAQGTSANCTTTSGIGTSFVSLAINSPGVTPTTANFALAGTYSGTVTFYASGNQGVTWSAFGVTPSAGGASVTTASANGNGATINGATIH
jgi:hypothetical protein